MSKDGADMTLYKSLEDEYTLRGHQGTTLDQTRH